MPADFDRTKHFDHFDHFLFATVNVLLNLDAYLEYCKETHNTEPYLTFLEQIIKEVKFKPVTDDTRNNIAKIVDFLSTL